MMLFGVGKKWLSNGYFDQKRWHFQPGTGASYGIIRQDFFLFNKKVKYSCQYPQLSTVRIIFEMLVSGR